MLQELYIAFDEANHGRRKSYTTCGGLEVERQTFCSYVSLRAAGCVSPPDYPGSTTNTIEPEPAAIARLAHDLEAAAKGKNVIRWEHVICCYGSLVPLLKNKLPLTIALFGDDCPGHTQEATFPGKELLDGILCEMYIGDWELGRTTQEIYEEAGIHIWRWGLLGALDSTLAYLNKHPETIEIRKTILRSSAWNNDVIFAGSWGIHNPSRVRFIQSINDHALENLSWRAKVHGWNGMRDGFIDPDRLLQSVLQSMAAINFPHSSIFNARFSDMALLGVPQIVADKNQEIEGVLGWKDREHYVNFDGTLEGLHQALCWCRDNPEQLAQIATNAERDIRDAIARRGVWPVWSKLLEDLFL